jgi:hypothetical protein
MMNALIIILAAMFVYTLIAQSAGLWPFPKVS